MRILIRRTGNSAYTGTCRATNQRTLAAAQQSAKHHTGNAANRRTRTRSNTMVAVVIVIGIVLVVAIVIAATIAIVTIATITITTVVGLAIAVIAAGILSRARTLRRSRHWSHHTRQQNTRHQSTPKQLHD